MIKSKKDFFKIKEGVTRTDVTFTVVSQTRIQIIQDFEFHSFLTKKSRILIFKTYT